MSSIETAFFGSLGADAEQKVSKNNKPYLRLRVRVGDGEGAQWVSVMAFDEKALAVAEKMIKGARVYVEGSLRLDQWEQQDGAKRAGLGVMSWHCRLAEIGANKPKRPGRIHAAASAFAPPAAADGIAFSDGIPF